MDARPFLRATSSLHARTTRVRFESRKTRSRLSPHGRFSTRPDGRKRFRKSEKKTRAQFSDSASRTLNVLKYVVAFFGPFWRNPRVNIFLVPCLRPLLRARWLPMVRRRLLFCEEEDDGVWKEGGGGTVVFSPFFSKSGWCCFRVFWKEGRKDKKRKTIIIMSSSKRDKM